MGLIAVVKIIQTIKRMNCGKQNMNVVICKYYKAALVVKHKFVSKKHLSFHILLTFKWNLQNHFFTKIQLIDHSIWKILSSQG